MAPGTYLRLLMVFCAFAKSTLCCGSKRARVSWQDKVFEAVHEGNVTKVRGVIQEVVDLVGLENLGKIVNIAKVGRWVAYKLILNYNLHVSFQPDGSYLKCCLIL